MSVRQSVLAGQGVFAHVTPCRACVQLQRVRRPHHSRHATSASLFCRTSALPCCSAATMQTGSASKKAPRADHKQQAAEACMTRRQMLQTLATAALAVALPKTEALAAEDVQFKTLSYPTLAFEFQYPVSTESGRKLPVIISRKPERYSSAAPMTADARQRIVAELVDFPDGITISVSVGPPPPWLNERKPDDWKPRDVANAVLIDRATARVTTGQRKSLDQIEQVQQKQGEDGNVYWTYDHISQGSPSTFTPTDRESFRRGSSVTSWRAGKDGKPYLYTLNLACPEERWAELGKLYHKAADSFKLTPPTKAYVSPDTSPWLFF
ncbi:TPA: hypothetical protein ACH3X2_012730 [Trebouxia sp. C0005]|nr:MAG: lumen targeted [Trebouxia sp. A1-2]